MGVSFLVINVAFRFISIVGWNISKCLMVLWPNYSKKQIGFRNFSELNLCKKILLRQEKPKLRSILSIFMKKKKIFRCFFNKSNFWQTILSFPLFSIQSNPCCKFNQINDFPLFQWPLFIVSGSCIKLKLNKFSQQFPASFILTETFRTTVSTAGLYLTL